MTVLETALALHAKGYPVILTGPDKNPGSVVGKDWQSYTWTEARFRDWLDRKPDCQLGIKLNPLVDVEIDAEGLAAVEAHTTLNELMGTTKTVSWKSRRGPHHLFTLRPDQAEVLRARRAPAVVKLGEIEVRLGGQDTTAQSLIPPSKTDGTSRDWGELSLLDAEPAELPDAIFDAVMAKLDERKDRSDRKEAREDRPGDVYNQEADWRELLEPAGWTFLGDEQGKGLWARPGRKTKVGATTGFCETDARPDMFYVFSESVDEIAPFVPHEAYTKFEAYALLHHEGDFQEATRALAAEGFEYSYPLLDLEEGDDNTHVVEQPADMPSPLPDDVFDNFLGQYVLENDRFTEAHRDSVYMQLMEIFGNFIGRGAYIDMNMQRQYLNGFLCVIGESGRGRKGTAWNVAKAPFERLTEAEHEKYASSRLGGGLASGEGLIFALRDGDDNGIKDKRYLAFASEIASVMPKLHADTSILSGTLRSAYDGEPLRNETKNNPATATGAHVSLIFHSTPVDFSDYVTASDIKNGLINRMMFVFTARDRVVYTLHPGDEDLLAHVADELEATYKWVHLHTQGLALTVAPEAQGKWRELYDEFSQPGRDDIWDALMVRSMNHVLRYAGRFAVLDQSTIIGPRHLRMAEAMVRKSIASVEALNTNRSQDAIKALYQYIADRGENGCTRTELHEHFGRKRGEEAIDKRTREALIDQLLEKKLVKKQKKAVKRGRPPIILIAR